MKMIRWVFLFAACATLSACTGGKHPEETHEEAMTTESTEPAVVVETLQLPAGDEPVPDDILNQVEKWTGDLDGMIERRFIRALVTINMTNYFLDGPVQRGITYDALKEFEKTLNERLESRHLLVHVVIIPVGRDQLLPALLEGRGDIAAANLTITPERLEVVDFSMAGFSGVSEILVTGRSAEPIGTLDDLSGKEIHVRFSSSYYASLVTLNEKLERAGKAKVTLVAADEHLEDEDLLQMVNAGLLPMLVIDSHKAEFWMQVFHDITVRPDLALRTVGEIAWMFRRDSPLLAAEVNDFIEKNKKGTLLGNMLFKRYLQTTKWVDNALSEGELKKCQETVGFFKKYGDQYEFDWLMLAALAYQESHLDQSVRSAAGAVGVMQLLPSTATDPNVGIPDIDKLEPNIHAGTKYLRFLRNRYFETEPMDDVEKALFTFASYNARPARVRGLREKAKAAGFDENVWFDNVEVIAAREIGRETVQYVGNIFQYYIAYRQFANQPERKSQATSSN